MQPGFPVKGIEFGQKLVEAFVGLFYLCSPGSPFQIEDAWRAQFGGRLLMPSKVSASRACEFAMRYTVSQSSGETDRKSCRSAGVPHRPERTNEKKACCISVLIL